MDLFRKKTLERIVNILKTIEKRKISIKSALRNYNRWDIDIVEKILVNTCKWVVFLDFCLNILLRESNREVNKLEPFVRSALRVSSYLILIENKFPAIFRLFKDKKRKFVFAIEKNLENKREELLSEVDKIEDTLERISIKYSFPLWIINRLSNFLDLKFIEDLAKTVLYKEKVQYLRINPKFSSKLDKIRRDLLNDGIYLRDTEIPLVFKVIGRRIKSRDYVISQGIFDLVDYSSMFSIYCLSEVIKENFDKTVKVVDACSSPGMKLSYLYFLLKDKVKLVAIEKNKRRFEILKKNLEKWDVRNVDERNIDFREYKEKCDVILLDVPCTSVGSIWNYPELRIILEEKYVDMYSKYQEELIKHAINLNPKFIFYSTCSFFVEENEEKIKLFVENGYEPIKLEINKNIMRGIGNYEFKNKVYRFWPNVNETNGFFFAILSRV